MIEMKIKLQSALDDVDTVNKATEIIEEVFTETNESLFVRHRAGEMLFDGYYLDFLEILNPRMASIGFRPERVPNNTFGLFYTVSSSNTNISNFELKLLYSVNLILVCEQFNETWHFEIDGTWTVHTGVGNDSEAVDHVGHLTKWNGFDHLEYWKGGENSTCNTIKEATDGGFFHPFMKPEERPFAYDPMACRSVALVYKEDILFDGIPALRFVAPDNMYAAPKKVRYGSNADINFEYLKD